LRIVEETLEKTFTDLISTSLEDNELKISPRVEIYVVEAMSNLSSEAHKLASRNVFLNDLLRKALGSKGVARREYLRITGDVALFVSGIFPDRFESKKTWFRLGDYIDIGQTAYGSMRGEVFAELSAKFPEVVDVLNTVSVKIDMTSQDLVKYIRRRKAIDARVTRR
jgi:hypothetical protein